MSRQLAEVVEVGVDWFTCTATNKMSSRKLYNSGMRLVEMERRNGNEKRLWSFSGYEGLLSGGVQVGQRHDGTIVRLTGGFANEQWSNIYERCDNVSRIDLQVTVKAPRTAPKMIARCYRDACAYSRSLQRGPNVATYRSLTGGATVYLGSRESQNFGRIYDKGIESGLDHYKDCVRFEREVKDDLALSLSARLAASLHRTSDTAGEVGQWFEKRLRTRCFAYQESTFSKGHARLSDRDRQLTWLNRSVRPTIQRIIASGDREAVEVALGLRGTAVPNIRLVRKVS